MRKDVRHINNQPEFNREMQEIISGSNIAWSKTKEEIWPEMLEKMEGKSSVSKKPKIIYLQLRRFAAAAVFLILVGIPAIMYFYTTTIDNPLTHQTEVFLPDNSKVIVNAQSLLSYKPLLWMFTRTVKFEGEASFEVQKGRKFEVVSKRGKTVVLGTQFTIYSRNIDYNVTCTSGKVKVIESVHRNEAVLIAGQKAILKPDGTFEIQNEINTLKESSNKTQDQTLEVELNEVLSTTATQTQTTRREQQAKSVEPGSIKEPVGVKEQGKPEEASTLNGQNKFPNQPLEELQKKEQTKTATQTQVENKEQYSKKDQVGTKEQSTGNQQKQDKFRASLTPEQIKILENKEMDKTEKRKAFMESLSDEQRLLLKEQNKERAMQAQDNKKETGVSDEMKEQQKMQTRDQLRENTNKETREQQMQQNRENQENTKQLGNESVKGSGNGNGPDRETGNQTGKGN